MSTARAATLLGPERLEIREYPVPEVADDGALLRIGLGGVCGTDVKYFRGRIDMPYPVILDTELCIRAIGNEIAGMYPTKAVIQP